MKDTKKLVKKREESTDMNEQRTAPENGRRGVFVDAESQPSIQLPIISEITAVYRKYENVSSLCTLLFEFWTFALA